MLMDRIASQTDITAAYEMLLGRDPEDLPALEDLTLTISSILKMILGSPEYQQAVRQRYRKAIGQSAERFISQLAWEQMVPWQICGIDKSTIEQDLLNISVVSQSIILFEIENSLVSFRAESLEKRQDEYAKIILERAISFQGMIEEAIADYQISRLTIAIDLTDCADEHLELPVFTFQKIIGQLSPLLPDFELFDTKFLELSPVDNISFDKKRTHAVFAGSTTGANVDLDVAMNRKTPRIRAGFAFRDLEDVTFRLPSLVQCTPEAERYLRAEGFGTGRIEWPETYESKFILSIDGNGATCTRTHLALKSNSVLMKYDSPFCLYYSLALTPWEHFVPIHKDENVLSAIAEERLEPGRFEPVARASREFAAMVLTRESIIHYILRIILIYRNLIN